MEEESTASVSHSEAAELNSLEPQVKMKRAVGLGEDLDKIEEFGMEMEEIPLGGSVYNVCSVEIIKEVVGGGSGDAATTGEGGKPVVAGMKSGDPMLKPKDTSEVWSFQKPRVKIRHRDRNSSWSLTKFIRNRLLICCTNPHHRDLDSSANQGIFEDVDMTFLSVLDFETEASGQRDDAKEPSETESGGTGAPLCRETAHVGILPQAVQSYRYLESIWIVDCNENAKNSEDNAKRFWFASDSLLMRNSPFSSVMDILNEPQSSFLQNVKHLHFENCDLSIEDLCSMLGKLQLVEEIRIRASTGVKTNYQMFRTHFMKEFQDSREDKDYFNHLRDRFGNSSGDHPQLLKALSIMMPMTWQCDLIYKAVEAVMNKTQLEVLVINSSLCDMVEFLVSPENNIDIENESTWEELVKLDCSKALKRSRDSLKELSLSCGNRFPLEHLRMVERLDTSIEAVFQWSFFCTAGILITLQDMNMTLDFDSDASSYSEVFPRLSTLNIDLPFIPVQMSRGDQLQTPMKTVLHFVARNNHIPKVSVCGLRPEKGLENWIKHSFVSISKNTMKVGCTYRSTTLGRNLETYDDELVSLAFTIGPDEKRRRVSEIIEPSMKDEQLMNPTWRYTGVRCLHIINQQPALMSFNVNRITTKFNHLTKLAIEDYTVRYDDSGRILGGNESGDCAEEMNRSRSLTDSDMQAIFRTLVSLEHLHLDCNMTSVTDFGLTGIGDSFWTRLSQRNKLFSFWYLNYLKYVFLRGLGNKVTDKSAVYAFSEDYSLSNLMELHLFAPGVTNFGKEKIRNAYAARSGFILEL